MFDDAASVDLPEEMHLSVVRVPRSPVFRFVPPSWPQTLASIFTAYLDVSLKMASANASLDLPPQQEPQTKKAGQGCEWEAPREDIEDEDNNMLLHLEWDRLQQEFFDYLQAETTTIETIVSQHLDLSAHQLCRVAARSQWLHGTFNVCVPVFVTNWRAQRVLIRCPLPHRLGGLHTTTLMEEKIRCEAASFAWLSRNSPCVPIPRLWGFGLPSGLRVSIKLF